MMTDSELIELAAKAAGSKCKVMIDIMVMGLEQ